MQLDSCPFVSSACAGKDGPCTFILSGRLRFMPRGEQRAATGSPWICGHAPRSTMPCTPLLRLPDSTAAADLISSPTLEAVSRLPLLPPHALAALAAGTNRHGRRELRYIGEGPPAAGSGQRAAFLYNPSVLDESNFLVRLSSLSWCTMNASHSPADVKANLHEAIRHQFSVTLWVQRGQIRRERILRSEDARVFRLHGRTHAVFKRVYGRMKKRMWLAVLEPTYRELPLRYVGMRRVEINWTPFVHNDTLFIAYTLCPHVVLRCEPASGACTQAYNTTPAGGCPGYQGNPGTDRAPAAMHGGTQMVHTEVSEAGGVLLGAAHFKLYRPYHGQAWWYAALVRLEQAANACLTNACPTWPSLKLGSSACSTIVVVVAPSFAVDPSCQCRFNVRVGRLPHLPGTCTASTLSSRARPSPFWASRARLSYLGPSTGRTAIAYNLLPVSP